MQNLYKQQQKLFQQQRIVQVQRLKRVRQLHEDYTKKSHEVDKNHCEQHVNVQDQLRKEICNLQKKILTDTVRTLFCLARNLLSTVPLESCFCLFCFYSGKNYGNIRKGMQFCKNSTKYKFGLKWVWD